MPGQVEGRGNYPCKPESVFSDMVILEDVIIVIMTDVIEHELVAVILGCLGQSTRQHVWS